MIRINDAILGLSHLVGWQQNYDTTDIVLSELLTKSETGIYFQQIHPLLTLENISSIAPNFANIVYPEYSSEKQYYIGQIVTFNEKLYKSIEKTTNNQPDISADFWVETNPFSEWLESKTKASIVKAIMRFYNEKLLSKTAKSLIENRILFDGTGRITDAIENNNNLVGFEIVPIRSKGVTTKINKIGLQFTTPGKYTIYIFHSSNYLPVYTLEFEKKKSNSLEWFSADNVYLPYVNEEVDGGGSWYICYAQSELPEGSKAIKKMKDWSKGPCKGCSRIEYQSWMAWSRFLEVHPFYINEEMLDKQDSLSLWDIEKNDYDYSTNYGLNLDITVECDYTDFILEQKHLFSDIISKQLAIDMLREFAYNPNVRTNRHSINASRTDILYEIDGDSSSMKKSGLSYQLDLAFKSLEISIQGIDRICLPCKNNGIRFKTI